MGVWMWWFEGGGKVDGRAIRGGSDCDQGMACMLHTRLLHTCISPHLRHTMKASGPIMIIASATSAQPTHAASSTRQR